MKRTLPLMAVLAATLAGPLTAPVAAQDISSILNPGNFAARLHTGGNPAFANLPSDMSGLFHGSPNAALRMNPALAGQIAALAPATVIEPSHLAPRTSMAPIPRGSIASIVMPSVATAPSVVTTPERGGDLIAMMADAAVAAPAGANTLVINGSNTAVIHSSPTVAEAPRLSLWQRLFGG